MKRIEILARLLCALFVAFAAASNAGADARTCPDVSLDSMNHVPVIDQGGLGICYSAAAVQMIDAWRFSHGDTNYELHTSLTAAVFDTAEDPGKIFAMYPGPMDLRRQDIEGGDTDDVLDYIRKHGACDRRLVAGGRDIDGAVAAFDNLKTYYKRFGKFATRYNIGFYNQDVLGSIPRIKAEREQVAQDLVSCMTNMGFPLDEVPTLTEVVRELNDGNREAFLAKALTRGCDGRRFKPGTPDSHNYGSAGTSNAKYWRKIDSLFAAPNPQPIQVSICDKFLSDPKYRGIDRDAWFKTHSNDCGEHALLLIGQHFNEQTGRCQYLLRNSWGHHCTAYSSDWQCQDGNVSVDRDALLDNTYGLTWLGG